MHVEPSVESSGDAAGVNVSPLAAKPTSANASTTVRPRMPIVFKTHLRAKQGNPALDGSDRIHAGLGAQRLATDGVRSRDRTALIPDSTSYYATSPVGPARPEHPGLACSDG